MFWKNTLVLSYSNVFILISTNTGAGRPGFPSRPASLSVHGPANIVGRITNGISRVPDHIARASGQVTRSVTDVVHHVPCPGPASS